MAPAHFSFASFKPLSRGVPAAPTVNPLRAALAGVLHVLTWPMRVGEARAAMRQLGGMTDYELRDIGLTRQDLRDATGLVIDEDPTQLLARRAAERSRFPRGW